MRREDNEPTKLEIEEYWTEIFTRRMKDQELFQRDIWRLASALEGQFYTHVLCELANNSLYSFPTIEEFWDSKRPYGNKDLASSIIFRLGWDEKGYLHWRLPQFVRDECDAIHALVLEDMRSEEEMFVSVFHQFKENISAVGERISKMKVPTPRRYQED